MTANPYQYIIYIYIDMQKGLIAMSTNKKILLTLPEELLSEIDAIILDRGISRSKFIREGLAHYVLKQKNLKVREQLEMGYREMGSINLALAEEWLTADNLQFENYLQMLSECEK